MSSTARPKDPGSAKKRSSDDEEEGGSKSKKKKEVDSAATQWWLLLTFMQIDESNYGVSACAGLVSVGKQLILTA